VHTGLGRNATGAFRILLTLTRPIQAPPARPASLIVRVLDGPAVVDGAYLAEKGPAARSPLALDDALAGAMREWTDKLLAPWLAAGATA
jgi:hypothetical protein